MQRKCDKNEDAPDGYYITITGKHISAKRISFEHVDADQIVAIGKDYKMRACNPPGPVSGKRHAGSEAPGTTSLFTDRFGAAVICRVVFSIPVGFADQI